MAAGDFITIEELDITLFPNRDQKVVVMLDGVTVQLSLEQVLSLIERGDLPLGTVFLDVENLYTQPQKFAGGVELIGAGGAVRLIGSAPAGNASVYLPFYGSDGVRMGYVGVGSADTKMRLVSDNGGVIVGSAAEVSMTAATTLGLTAGTTLSLNASGAIGLNTAGGPINLNGTFTDAKSKQIKNVAAATADADAVRFDQIRSQELAWAAQPLGVPIPIMSNLVGVDAPPTDKAYRYIVLTVAAAAAGYNTGVLVSETVTGSAPLLSATAVISLAGSPLNGQTVRLINSERRFLRAGSPGTVENDQMQQITGGLNRIGSNRVVFNSGTGVFDASPGSELPISAGTGSVLSLSGNITFDSANSAGARAGTETRAKNLGVSYYMRIK